MNKKFTKLIAALALLVFMTPSLVGWGQATVYTSNVTLPVSGTNVSSCKVKINNTDYDATKLGKSGSGASANVTIPAGTTKLYVHCAAWNGKTSTLTLSTTASGVSINPSGAWSLTSDSGISGSSTTFTLNAPSNASTVYFKEYTLSGVNSQISVKFEAGGERAVFWGVNTATGGGSSTESITISPSTISAEYTGITSTGYDSNALSITTENISNLSLNGFSVVYSDTENGTFTNETPSWMQAYVVQSSSFKVGYSIYENSTQIANECYFKVMYSETASNAVHVTQSAAPAPTYTVTLSGNSINADYQGNVTSSTITVSTNLTGDEIIYDIYYNNNGTYTSTNPYSDWFVAEVNANNEIECTIDDNLTGTERPAQFKVYALDDEYNEAYSEVITLTQAAQPQVATPTFSPAAGAVALGTEVSISCATENATIYYTVNNGDITEYAEPIVITEATTIQAFATADGYSDSETVTANYTIAEIHTVAWALENTPSTGVYVQGIVSSFYNESIMGDGQNFRYYISDNGGTYNGELLVYKGKDLGNVAFNSVDDLMIGDVVTIYGDLYNYQGTKEFNAGNYIVDKTRPVHNPYDLTLPEWENFELYTFIGLESEWAFDYDDDEADHWGTIQVNDGTQVELSVSANQDYAIQTIFVDGVDVTDQLDESGLYVFMMPAHDVTVTVTATRLPYNTISFTTNGIADGTIEVTQGQAIGTLPTATAEYIPAGYTFIGWLATDYEVSNTAPEGLITADYTPSADVTLKAVFAIETPGTATIKTDNLTTSTFGSPSSYSTWSDKSATGGSDAVYAGNSTTNNSNAIQIRATKPSGIVSTTSGGKAKKVTVSWNNDTQTGRTLDVYGKNVAYTGSANLYNDPSNTQGTKLGSIVCGTSTELTISGDYQYIGMRSNSNAMYIDQISIEWESSTPSTYSNYRTLMQETCTLTITGYNNGGGWNLIASPVTMTPSTNDIITDTYTGIDNTQRTYDLYYFDQTAESEWKNYRQHSFNLVPGKGYLYANKTGGTYTLAGTPYNGDGIIPLDYSEVNPSESMRGLNLIGNPYNAITTIESDREFYIMNSAGSQIIVADDDHKTIAPMQGIFVKAEEPGESVTFTPASQGSSLNNNSSLVLNLIQNRGDVIDRAIVRFGNGGTLPKIQLFENSTKLYISQYNEDYAVVKAEAQGEMPVNFRAAENGTYTLSIDAENVEMNYLHLIDNMTGMDIDLLQTPNYTFEANTRDYESRFRLVFAGASTGSATDDNFAFFSNGNLIINNDGNATLQVIDITGRILSSESVNGSVSTTLNATPGVYMLRLINGENVKVQKIVVR